MADGRAAIFDIKILQYQYEGMPTEMQGQALRLFLTQGAEYCDTVCNFQSHSEQEVFRCYHSLKTMCAMVGATRLKQLCIKFEQATEDTQRQNISEQIKVSWVQTDKVVQSALLELADA